MKRSRITTRTIAHSLTLGLALLVAALAAGADDATQAQNGRAGWRFMRRSQSYDAAKVDYDESLKLRTFFERARGIVYLADTGDPRALQILSERYFTGGDPIPHTAYKYLIAGACGDGFRNARHVDAFDAWATKAKEPLDAYVDWHAYRMRAAFNPVEEVTAIAMNSGQPALVRAAALEAMVKEKKTEILALVPKILDEKVKDEVDRALLLESCAAALTLHDGKYGAEFVAAAEAVIDQMKKAPKRSELVLARRLKKALGHDEVYLDPKAWRALLESKKNDGATEFKRPRTAAKMPEFLGIKSPGKRIVFVIDASDSMLKELTKLEIEKLRVLTGPGSHGGDKEKDKKDPKKGSSVQDRLDWSKIKTRWDAARETLKLTLQELPEDIHFAVIAFGTQVNLFGSTDGLVPSNKGKTNAAIKELEAIKPGKTQWRELGLLGNTNLHGAMLRAFRVKNKGMLESEDEHVHKTVMLEGCDTIFLLSDGNPTVDDFREETYPIENPNPQKKGPVKWVDPETGEEKIFEPGHRATWWPNGPYIEGFIFMPDIERLNVYRKVEMNCIGIGEVDEYWLKGIADIGLGSMEFIGK